MGRTNSFCRHYRKEVKTVWPFRRKEKRSIETGNEITTDQLLSALISKVEITRKEALEIPSINAAVSLLQGVISSLPVKLYEKRDGVITEIKDDERVFLINDDTRGNMTGSQLKKAIVDNYLLGKGAYIYIDKSGTKINSLRFVEEKDISIYHNEDAIFKDYSIMVRGQRYFPHEFIKIIRKTTDGFTSNSIIDENNLILSVAYNSLLFENKIVKKGGNKRGFLTSEHSLTKDQIRSLKKAWNNMYSNNDDNVVILNKGMDFKESSNTSVEMQLNENKITNSEELSMLLNVSNKMIRGEPSDNDINNFVKFCVVPILVDIEDSLNRDFLFEKEKKIMYWSFDTAEISRGSFKERMEGYKIALESNIMQLDEVRDKEDLPALEFNYIKLDLNTVLYDLKNKTIYTPNTNKIQQMGDEAMMEGGETDESGNQE